MYYVLFLYDVVLHYHVFLWIAYTNYYFFLFNNKGELNWERSRWGPWWRSTSCRCAGTGTDRRLGGGPCWKCALSARRASRPCLECDPPPSQVHVCACLTICVPMSIFVCVYACLPVVCRVVCLLLCLYTSLCSVYVCDKFKQLKHFWVMRKMVFFWRQKGNTAALNYSSSLGVPSGLTLFLEPGEWRTTPT